MDKLLTTKFLFDKIRKLYPTFDSPDELDVDIWTDVLDGYSQTEILDALKEYRKNVEYNTPPIPGTFKKFLKHTDTAQIIAQAAEEFKAIAPAEQFMQHDVELKRCRHLLSVYKKAVDYVLGEKLLQEVPVLEWRKMNFESRYIAAKNKGLFGNFDDVLVGVCRRDYGKDYQFESETMLEAIKQNRAFNVREATEELGNVWKNSWWHN